MNAVSEIEPPVEISGSTPGAMLRREREQRGLTVQQVSEELHLDTWLVEALEENRFLALGAPVYAKGHLRKYAVLLGLSPELILSLYQAIAQPPPLPPPPQEALMAPLPGARRLEWQRMDWRMYSIIGGLMLTAVGATWLISRPPRTDGPNPQVAANTGRAAVTEEPLSEQDVPEAEPAAAAQPSQSAQPSQNAQPPQSAPARAATAPVRTPVTAAERPAVAVQAPSTNTAPPPAQQARTGSPPAAGVPHIPASSTTPAAIAATSAASPATTVPASDAAPTDPLALPEEVQVSLRLEFSAASWAEVYDGDGRRLLYAIGDPNRARTISGKPPLKVTLGTAGSVQARVNGRPIAIPRRIGQDSATFTVNANGSIRQPGR